MENSVLKFDAEMIGGSNLGKISIKHGSNLIPAINEITFKCRRKKLKLYSYSNVKETEKELSVTVIFEKNLSFIITLRKNSPVILIKPDFYDALALPNLVLQVVINLRRENDYDYINFSGNTYRKVQSPEKICLKVPPTGAFGQVWTIHSKDLYCGIIGLAPAMLVMAPII